MADKCITLCADHLCLHNSCSGYYGVCALSALSVGARCGLARDYVETCPKKEHIPRCIARGPGKLALFDHGRAGNGKSTMDLERTFVRIMKTPEEVPWTSVGFDTVVEPRTFTAEEIIADLQRMTSAIKQFKAVPKPEITPWSQGPFILNPIFAWDDEDQEEV